MHHARTSPIFYILWLSLPEGLQWATHDVNYAISIFLICTFIGCEGEDERDVHTHMRWISEANTQRHFRAIKKILRGWKNFTSYPHNSKNAKNEGNEINRREIENVFYVWAREFDEFFAAFEG